MLLFGLIGKDEGSLAGPKQFQLLANLQLLLGRAFLQLLDALAAIVVLALKTGVVLFKLTDFAPFIHQGRNALRTAQRHVSIHANQNENDQHGNAPEEVMHSQQI
jgi:hypothetical protein